MSKSLPKKRKFVDWDSIEPLYRAGSMSLNDICRQYAADHVNSQVWKTSVDFSAVSRKAKEKKWTKNLADKIKERVQEKLVSGLVNGLDKGLDQTDESLIEAASIEPVQVGLGQRARTHRLLKDQDDIADELRANKEDLDLMSRVRAWKDVAASVKMHHADQASQYNLKESSHAEKSFEEWLNES